MEVRKPHIKSIPYNEFKDNDTLEKITKELNEGGVNVIVGSLDQAITLVSDVWYIMLWY